MGQTVKTTQSEARKGEKTVLAAVRDGSFLLTVLPMAITIFVTPILYSAGGRSFVVQDLPSLMSNPMQDIVRVVLHLSLVFVSFVLACIALTRTSTVFDLRKTCLLFFIIWVLLFMRSFISISRPSSGFVCAQISILMGYLSVCTTTRGETSYVLALASILFLTLAYSFQRKFAILAFFIIAVYAITGFFSTIVIRSNSSLPLLLKKRAFACACAVWSLILLVMLFNQATGLVSRSAASIRYSLADKGALSVYLGLYLVAAFALREKAAVQEISIALMGMTAMLACYFVFASRGFSSSFYLCAIPTILPIVWALIDSWRELMPLVPKWAKASSTLLCCTSAIFLCEGILSLDALLSLWGV